MQQPRQAYIERSAPSAAPLRAPPSPLAAPPLSLAWPTPPLPPALAAHQNADIGFRTGQQIEMAQASSPEGIDSFEEEDKGRQDEPVRSFGLTGKRPRSPRPLATEPIEQCASSDPPDGKRHRPSAPATSSSHHDPHKLDLRFPSAWTPADELVLVKAVEESFKSGGEREGDGIDWAGVVEALPGKRRTRRQVEGRWNALVQQVSEALSYLDDDAQSVSSPDALDKSSSPTSAASWTTDEDARLVSALKHHSIWTSTQPLSVALPSTSSPRSPWLAVKARFDSSANVDTPDRDRTAADLAERWRHLQYSAGTFRTRRAQAEAAIDLERAEWTESELDRLVRLVVGLGGSVERNAAGWEGEVEATSRWVQVHHRLGKATSLIDVCLAWCEVKDGAASASPASALDSPTSRSPSPVHTAAEPLEHRLPTPPAFSSTLPPASLSFVQLSLESDSIPSTSSTAAVPPLGASLRYTADEDAIIIADQRDGILQSITAERLGRPLSGIRGRVKALRKKGVISAARRGTGLLSEQGRRGGALEEEAVRASARRTRSTRAWGGDLGDSQES